MCDNKLTVFNFHTGVQLSKNRSDWHADDYKVMLVYSYTEHSSLHDHVLSAEKGSVETVSWIEKKFLGLKQMLF